MWSNNNLSYPKGIAEDEAVFFPLIALSDKVIITQEVLYMYRLGRKGSITMAPLNIKNIKDYLDRIYSSIEFMRSKENLIKKDIKAWNTRLERKGINLIFIIKILWRILKFFTYKFIKIFKNK